VKTAETFRNGQDIDTGNVEKSFKVALAAINLISLRAILNKAVLALCYNCSDTSSIQIDK
jgi:hypothetical protein